MAKSSIKIYKTELMPEKNFKIEGIQDYLDEYCTVTYSNDNFQYIQLKADIEIKINNFQSLISELNVGNYVRIEQDNRVWYYFVLSYEWKSKKTIKLYLSLDSVNTITDIVFNDKTTVYREHRSRTKIDNIPEGIQPVFYKVPQDDNLILEDGTHKDWFLIYKNHTADTNAALDCFLCTSDNIHIIADASTSYINISRLKIGYTYIVDGSIKVGEKEFKSGVAIYPVIHKTADKTEVNLIGSNAGLQYEWLTTTENILITSNAIKARYNSQLVLGYAPINQSELYVLPSTYESSFIKSIDEIDRTDAKLNKIMRLPYCPVDYTYNNGIYGFDTEKIKYNKDENLLQIKDLNMKFSHRVIPNPVVNPFPTLWKNPSPIDARDDNYESKLYSSEFYQPRFVYDSFVYTFALEDLSQIIKYDNLVFNYVHTSTINSKSLIDFYNFRYKRAVVDYPGYLLINRNDDEVIYNSPYINYIKNGINYDKRNANFNLWSGLASSVFGVGGGLLNAGVFNKKVTIDQYTTAYKANRILKDLATDLSTLRDRNPNVAKDNMDYELLGTVKGSMAHHTSVMQAYERQQNNQYGRATGISSIASAIGGIASNIVSRIGAEMSIEQATEQAKNQAVSVTGADDIDLLKVYSKNKAKLSIYKTSDTMKKLLGNLFYYTGYNSESRQYKPDIDSRYWFNFLQCDLEIPYDTLTGVPNEYLDDLRIRYNKGVTIFHKHITPIASQFPNKPHYWNIDQTLENAEINNIYYDVTGKYVVIPGDSVDYSNYTTKFTLSLTLNSKPVSNILEQYITGRISVSSDEFLEKKYYMTYDETTNTYSFTIDKAFNQSELEIYLNKEDSSGNVIVRGLRYKIYKSEE